MKDVFLVSTKLLQLYPNFYNIFTRSLNYIMSGYNLLFDFTDIMSLDGSDHGEKIQERQQRNETVKLGRSTVKDAEYKQMYKTWVLYTLIYCYRWFYIYVSYLVLYRLLNQCNTICQSITCMHIKPTVVRQVPESLSPNSYSKIRFIIHIQTNPNNVKWCK